MALYNYNGLVAPGLRLYNFWVHFHSVGFVFPAALPARGVVVSASASVLVGREVDSWPGLTKTL